MMPDWFEELLIGIIWLAWIGGIFYGPLWVVRRLNRKIDTKQAALIAGYTPDDQVFEVPKQMPGIALWVVLALVGVLTIPFVIGLSGDAEGWRVFFTLIPILIPVGLPLWGFDLPNRGFVVLTKDGVVHHHLGRVKTLNYSQIESIAESQWLFPRHLLVKGADSTIRINSWIDNYPTLMRSLRERSQLIEDESTDWRVRSIYLWLPPIIGTVLFSFSVLVAWMITCGDEPYAGCFWGLFSGISGWVLLGIALFLMVTWLSDGIRPLRPWRIAVDEESFIYQYPFRKPVTLPLSQLKRMTLASERRVVRRRGITVTAPMRPLTIELKNGKKIKLHEIRARQFGSNTIIIYDKLKPFFA